MTTENRNGMKDVSASNLSRLSRKPQQCVHVTTPYAGDVVEVTFRNHCNAYDMSYDMFPNTTLLFSIVFNSRQNNNAINIQNPWASKESGLKIPKNRARFPVSFIEIAHWHCLRCRNHTNSNHSETLNIRVKITIKHDLTLIKMSSEQ